MSEGFISRGFRGRRKPGDQSARIPPGQYLERGFPVLSAGPTPHTSLENWDFSIIGEVDQPKRWSWEEFRALPRETITKDIHCVTKWSKLDTHWEGVSLDTVLAQMNRFGRIPVCAPIGPLDAVRRRKLNDACKIADRHSQNTRTALALKENTTGLPGARARSRTASSVTTAMSSTPTSAVTWTPPPPPPPGPRRARLVTRP